MTQVVDSDLLRGSISYVAIPKTLNVLTLPAHPVRNVKIRIGDSGECLWLNDEWL
jgi:hypothetical protein